MGNVRSEIQQMLQDGVCKLSLVLRVAHHTNIGLLDFNLFSVSESRNSNLVLLLLLNLTLNIQCNYGI